MGAKRAWMCADCAYAMPDPVPVDRVQNVVAQLILDHKDKWGQAQDRPQLLGWFVGRAMKALGGNADPDEVFEKVMRSVSTGGKL
ncbi:hypothetical protein [Bradyrhizobium sp. DASA03007]|uniref:hypothetical protein n=1 Tax=unclassified Bradyrhizobium TaxID=2631580 RepID=UPI003F6F97C1